MGLFWIVCLGVCGVGLFVYLDVFVVDLVAGGLVMRIVFTCWAFMFVDLRVL